MAGRWMDVEQALGRERAREMAAAVEAELLRDPGFVAKASQAMGEGREPRCERRCLLVLGPSAAGKSKLISDGRLVRNCPEGALVLDGGYIREVSASWAQAASLAKSVGLVGFSDYFERYFKPPMDKVKEQIVSDALARGANLIVPETASSLRSATRTVDRIVAAGYSVTLAAVYADRATCEARGAERTDKKYSSKNWEASVQAIIDVHAHLRCTAPSALAGAPQLFCNTGEPHAVPEGRLAELLAAHRVQAAAARPQSRWCETRLLAGVYAPEGGAEQPRIEIVPASLVDESAAVSVSVIHAGALSSALHAKFDVAACRLSSDALGTWQLGFRFGGQVLLEMVSVGTASLPSGPWRQVGRIGGMSLATFEDAALEGVDICRDTLRDATSAEFAEAAAAARLEGPRSAPARAAPQALLVVGPSGGGKSRVIDACAGEFGTKVEEVVVVDSEAFKECHAQYRALLRHARASGGIWFRSWPAAKGAIAKAKQQILEAARKKKQDLMISDTGSEPARLQALVEALQADGYTVDLCCIFADPKEIVQRGVAREFEAGKRYNRDVAKLGKSFDAFPAAVRAINGSYRIVRNAQGREPEVYLQGRGGSDVAFDLDSALAWSPEPRGAQATVEPCDVAAEDLAFVMEGNRNVVFAYSGADPALRGSVLRCLKVDSEEALRDQAFYLAAAEPLFGPELVDRRRLVGLTVAAMSAIDEAFLEQRPPKRRCKRLSTSATHASGRVLALQVPNLLVAPLPGGKIVTVELKPKCGLRERLGLPSRFQLLQLKKLSTGKEKRRSHYDPVALLSQQPALVREALCAAFAEPQNTLRVFADGALVFSEDRVSPSFDEDLAAAGLPGGRDAVVALLVEVLASPAARVAERLRRAQAWAAGETAALAVELYKALARHRPGEAEELLREAENVALAVRGVEALPCDERGIDEAGQGMREALERVRAQPWDAALERDVVRWCCRFLMGRMAHDVSVMISFAQVRGADPAIEAQLGRMRYAPLGEASAGGRCWVRTTVVDIDQKDAAKIPEYAAQLDELAKAYIETGGRDAPGDAAPAAGGVTAGGHANGSIAFEGGAVWKRDQGGLRGRTELDFYRWSMEDEGIRGLVPEFVGYRVRDGAGWLGLSNSLAGFDEPCLLDIKMGTRTWTTKASAEKAAAQAKKCALQTGPLGLRVVGGRLRRPGAAADAPMEPVGYQNKRPVEDEAQLAQLLRDFLGNEQLRASAIAQVMRIQAWWAAQSRFAIYASSLFVAYDFRAPQECRVRMIDFANVEQITCKSEDLSGFGKGLETLLRNISGGGA